MQMIFTKITNRNRGRFFEKRLWHQASSGQGFSGIQSISCCKHRTPTRLVAQSKCPQQLALGRISRRLTRSTIHHGTATRLFRQMHRWLSEIVANGFLRLFSKTHVAQQCFSERLCVGPEFDLNVYIVFTYITHIEYIIDSATSHHVCLTFPLVWKSVWSAGLALPFFWSWTPPSSPWRWCKPCKVKIWASFFSILVRRSVLHMNFIAQMRWKYGLFVPT